jgi:hypothetical protein
MRVRSKLTWILPLVGLAYVALPAQGAPVVASSPGLFADKPVVGFGNNQQLAPGDQVAQGDTMIQQIEANARSIDEKYRRAHDERDVVKSLCLNDKLSQANSAFRTGKERHDQLKAAGGRGDADTAGHHFNILSVIKQRSDQLVSEANQCIGNESNFQGGTSVSTSVDSNLPPSNDTPWVSDPGSTLTPAPPIGGKPPFLSPNL